MSFCKILKVLAAMPKKVSLHQFLMPNIRQGFTPLTKMQILLLMVSNHLRYLKLRQRMQLG